MLITAPIFTDPHTEEYTERMEDPEFICKLNNWNYQSVFLTRGRKFICPRAITIDDVHLPEPERTVKAKPWTHDYWTLAIQGKKQLVLHRWTYIDQSSRFTLELDDPESDVRRYATLIDVKDLDKNIRELRMQIDAYTYLKSVTAGCFYCGGRRVTEDRQFVNAQQTKLKGTVK